MIDVIILIFQALCLLIGAGLLVAIGLKVMIAILEFFGIIK